jgi:putative heme-binding domain-containing protein
MKHSLLSGLLLTSPLSLFAQTAAPEATTVASLATPVSNIKVHKDFKVELLYSVPKETEGSWVSMTIDDLGRLITSDQDGPLYRITPPALGGNASDTKVEKLKVDFGHAQGLLWHKGVIYGQVNAEAHKGRGLYKVTASKGDDQFDSAEALRIYEGKSGEHGPHAVVLTPDGKGLLCVVGNQTPVTAFDSSRAPTHWGEDQLFPMIAGKGFMRDVLAPGGWTARTAFDGKKWELLTVGTRNTYDGAFNQRGDFFGYDADMEWDTNTPWYRPTRVGFMQSGAEFGWRTCSKKWPVRWEDNLPPVVDIGFGSPTGVAFGYGSKFPAKYQNALFMCDWSYGKLHAVHLNDSGAGYSGEDEEFLSASPLPLTDLVVSPKDGALYFTIGGRKTQSGLYRVTYIGKENTAPAQAPTSTPLHDLRRSLEAFHVGANPKAIEEAWPHLGHADRFIRFAARIAVEHQPVAQWQEKALSEKNPRIALTALMALSRSAKGDKSLQPRVLAALNKIDLTTLKGIDRVTLIRDYELALIRLGELDAEGKAGLVKHLGLHFPTKDPMLNRDLCELLVYLDDASIVSKAVPLLSSAPTQEEQIDYARILRLAKHGWNTQLREDYFKWFPRAANYKGGASFDLFVGQIKADAVKGLTEEEKVAFKEIIDAKPEPKAASFTVKPMQFVKAWTMAELEKSLGVGLEGNRDFENGRNMFGAAACFACHRFNQEGGAVGPDLTSVSGKFSPRDLLEQIIEPSKVISDQYGSTVFTMNDGTEITGRIANMKDDTLMVCTNMLDPNNFTNISRKKVVKMEESKLSMMPPGLLSTLKEDDVLDLLAYLLSKGDASHPLFKK